MNNDPVKPGDLVMSKDPEWIVTVLYCDEHNDTHTVVWIKKGMQTSTTLSGSYKTLKRMRRNFLLHCSKMP